jgi:syntaxin 18
MSDTTASQQSTLSATTGWTEDVHEDMDAFEQQLSQEQMQQLEKENETMLEEMNTTLNQVRQAEKALLEISTLQSQLTNHLAVQTLQTDRLYGDSLATTERVEQGNLQLIQAKERNRGTRKFMLIFLLGASLVLLFLDWYS